MSIQYLSGTATTCIVLEGGDIVTVQEDQLSGNGAHIEIVGSIDAGIAAARWSPDEELLAAVTKANTVIFMGGTFDPVVEVTMTPEDLKASNHVSVGWGKKETQFQGKGAKALRDPTIPEKVDQGVLSSKDDAVTTITWRGDGAYLAINATEEGPEGRRRLIRVYSREGELDSASEPVDGLEGTLSWRPAGNLIAGIQRFQDRVDVVFFERNGLRHGQFTLRSPDSPVLSNQKIRLEWNSDSTVLAVILDHVVQLWTMGNYHWYLKQEIPMKASSVCVSWHPEKALQLSIVASVGLVIAEMMFHIARGSCRPPFDNGAVAVIDGGTVKLTPFRTANVPPPMALFEVTVESAAIDVVFDRHNQQFAVLHRRGVDIFEWPMSDGRSMKPQLKHKSPFGTQWSQNNDSCVALRIFCNSEGKFRCINYYGDKSALQTEVSTHVEAGTMAILEEQQLLATTFTFEDESVIEGYGQDHAGKLYRLGQTENQLLPIQFHTQLPHFEIAKVDEVTVAFGLSRNGHIYANSRLLAKNCTSFILTPSHLILTTNNHFVKFVHLSSDIDGKPIWFSRLECC